MSADPVGVLQISCQFDYSTGVELSKTYPTDRDDQTRSPDLLTLFGSVHRVMKLSFGFLYLI